MIDPRRLTALVTLSVVGSLLAPVTSVVASVPQDVTINAHTEYLCPAASSCVFVAHGAIEDYGTVTSIPIVISAINSPVVGTAQWRKTFVGQQGSFVIKLESRVTGAELQVPETGQWVIVSGTGAYADLQGQGSETGVRDYGANSLEAFLTGTVH